MVEYSKVNEKLTDTRLQKLKITVKNITGTILRMSLKMFDKSDLPYELLLTKSQKAKLRNAFNNNMSTDIKLCKAQISKIIQSGLLGSLLSKLAGSWMKFAVPLTKKHFSSVRNYNCCLSNWCRNSKRKIHGSGTTTLIMSNEEMNNIMKIVQAFENSNILLKGVTETIKNETREQGGGFLRTLVGTFESILLGNLLSGKRNVKAVSGNKKEKGIVRPSFGKE